MVIGDFNAIASQSEKNRGNHFASSSNHSLLDDLNNLTIIVLGFHGFSFTWNNKRAGKANIQERLDREVANSS